MLKTNGSRWLKMISESYHGKILVLIKQLLCWLFVYSLCLILLCGTISTCQIQRLMFTARLQRCWKRYPIFWVHNWTLWGQDLAERWKFPGMCRFVFTTASIKSNAHSACWPSSNKLRPSGDYTGGIRQEWDRWSGRPQNRFFSPYPSIWLQRVQKPLDVGVK